MSLTPEIEAELSEDDTDTLPEPEGEMVRLSPEERLLLEKIRRGEFR